MIRNANQRLIALRITILYIKLYICSTSHKRMSFGTLKMCLVNGRFWNIPINVPKSKSQDYCI